MANTKAIPSDKIKTVLSKFSISDSNPGCFSGKFVGSVSKEILVSSPIDDSIIAGVASTSKADYEHLINNAQEAFAKWAKVPAPMRGELVRRIGLKLREHKSDLAFLLSIEMGKILAESEGEIQEAIDVADFAVGLSRQLCGQVIQSERKEHKLIESWHPLGLVGVITAFNFPAAVWAWNAMIAAVCGDVIVWKPSEKTPLISIAIHKIASAVCIEMDLPDVFHLLIGGIETGKYISEDRRIALVSATGSCEMGRKVGEAVAKRFGKSLLELGGNNAITVMPDADLDLALRAIFFSAVGTAGQRCTSARRLFVHKDISKELLKRLVKAYSELKPGNPLTPGVLLGPLVSDRSVQAYTSAISTALSQGAELLVGNKIYPDQANGLYVAPSILLVKSHIDVMSQETFAPILYAMEISSLSEAIELNNCVEQGLSSSIFTSSLKNSEIFLANSDCGLVNVNVGTSGAEIGGAFGGEKSTGGGRESGSDSWKQYMRRQTSVINYSDSLPLAQGVQFELKSK